MSRFSPERYAIDVNYLWLDVPEERELDRPMEPVRGWMVMYLVHKKWNGRAYLLNIREGWSTEQYFEQAERRFRELGITEP